MMVVLVVAFNVNIGVASMALAAGFRGIDTANQRKHYDEEGVGRALTAALASGRFAWLVLTSPRTVEVHRANLMAKMQAKSLSELIRMALFARMGDAGGGVS